MINSRSGPGKLVRYFKLGPLLMGNSVRDYRRLVSGREDLALIYGVQLDLRHVTIYFQCGAKGF
jgi:hypothetical protein